MPRCTQEVPPGVSTSWCTQRSLCACSLQATRTGLKKAAKTAKKSTPENKHGAEGTLLGASPEAQAALPTEEELRKMKMPQLKETAQKLGIPPGKLKKEQLLAALLEHSAGTNPEQDTNMAVVSAE
jgi:hypothetical protein